MHETRIANLKRPLRKSLIDENFLAKLWHRQKRSRTEVVTRGLWRISDGFPGAKVSLSAPKRVGVDSCLGVPSRSRLAATKTQEGSP